MKVASVSVYLQGIARCVTVPCIPTKLYLPLNVSFYSIIQSTSKSAD